MRKHRKKIIFLTIFILFIPVIFCLFNTLKQDKALQSTAFPTIPFNLVDEQKDQRNENSMNQHNQYYTTLLGHFETPIAAMETLWFYSEHTIVSIFINGKEIYSFKPDEESFTTLYPNESSWQSFRVPAISTNDKVSIHMQSPYEENESAISTLISSFHTGDGSNLYRDMMANFDVWLLIALITSIAGWIYMLEGLIYMASNVQEGKRIALAGFYFFCGGVWSLTDCLYPYLSLIISPLWFVSLLDTIRIFLFSVSLVLLLYHYIHDTFARKVMKVILASTIVLSTIGLLSQYFNILTLNQQTFFICFFGISLVFSSLFCISIELRKHPNRHLYLLLLAITPAFFVISLEALNMVWSFMPDRSFFRYGFSLSATIMITQLSSFAKQEAATKNSIIAMKNELTESRIAIMLSQIQPHFLYNALGSIADLCSKDANQAEEAITEFALFLRGNLESLTSPDLISFDRELEHTAYYINLEKLRFGKRLNVTIETPVTQFLLPCLTLQPIVENAIRHGVTQKKHGGCVYIQTSEDEHSYIITVQDDGTGFKNSDIPHDRRSHIGIANVTNRLQVQCKATLNIQSELQQGTTVTIRIPKEDN